MHTSWMYRLILTSGLAASLAHAQQTCVNGIRVDGTITDPTGAMIPGAQVRTSVGEKTMTDAAGHYLLLCLPATSAMITVEAEGFAQGTAQARSRAGGIAHVNLQLTVASVQADVQVSGDTAADAERGAGTINLDMKAVQRLADDPDDFRRELQVLASAAGGNPTSTMIRVDGFQNGSALPPKSSIASIRVDPDLFSSEYQFPPFGGGQIEITTKPGADSFHGALFFTDSDGSFNATDPFSATATPGGKRRYVFELSGPIRSKKTSFALALEKRDIDEFNVVNAQTLDSNGNAAPYQQTVSAPQRLWIASARGNWQVTPNDVAALSFSANVNNLGNQGVGGLVLADAGYSSLLSEYDLRMTNTRTINSNALHETRIGYSWRRTGQTPLSTAPSVQVAGYFTGGGATSQALNDRERDLEIDDDLVFAKGRHELKIGAQSLGIFLHNYDPNTFNGAYVLGGGSAPVLDANNNPTGQTESILPIEQYRRTLLNCQEPTPPHTSSLPAPRWFPLLNGDWACMRRTPSSSQLA